LKNQFFNSSQLYSKSRNQLAISHKKLPCTKLKNVMVLKGIRSAFRELFSKQERSKGKQTEKRKTEGNKD